jgi:hypothetical protein
LRVSLKSRAPVARRGLFTGALTNKERKTAEGARLCGHGGRTARPDAPPDKGAQGRAHTRRYRNQTSEPHRQPQGRRTDATDIKSKTAY